MLFDNYKFNLFFRINGAVVTLKKNKWVFFLIFRENSAKRIAFSVYKKQPASRESEAQVAI